MTKNKMTARVLEHPNGQKRERAQTRVSIVHHPRRNFKRCVAKLTLTVCGLLFLTSLAGLAEGVEAPDVVYLVGAVLTANRAAGVLLAGERRF